MGSSSSFLSYKSLKLKLRVFLAGHAVTDCSISTPGKDRIIVDYIGLNTVPLLANTPPFAHNNQQPFDSH